MVVVVQWCCKPGGAPVTADQFTDDTSTQEGRAYAVAGKTETENHFPLERLGHQEGEISFFIKLTKSLLMFV